MTFFLPLGTCRFLTPIVTFYLNSSLFRIYFTLILPNSLFFRFLHFSFPVFLFLLHGLLFLSSTCNIFPPNYICWYYPSREGEDVFTVYTLIIIEITKNRLVLKDQLKYRVGTGANQVKIKTRFLETARTRRQACLERTRTRASVDWTRTQKSRNNT